MQRSAVGVREAPERLLVAAGRSDEQGILARAC
jgi:hypothetical protein